MKYSYFIYIINNINFLVIFNKKLLQKFILLYKTQIYKQNFNFKFLYNN